MVRRRNQSRDKRAKTSPSEVKVDRAELSATGSVVATTIGPVLLALARVSS